MKRLVPINLKKVEMNKLFERQIAETNIRRNGRLSFCIRYRKSQVNVAPTLTLGKSGINKNKNLNNIFS